MRSSLLTLVVVAVCGLGYRSWLRRPAVSPTAKDRVTVDLDRISRLAIGVEGTLSDPVHGNVLVGRTREDLDAMTEAEDSDDDIGLRELVVAGRGFRVLNGNGADLEEKGPYGTLRVHLAGGDHGDEEGWTSGEYFH